MTLAAFIERSRREKESWKYTHLETLLAALSLRVASNSNIAKNADEHTRLVFINGVWQAKLSHLGAVPSCILMGDLETGYRLTLGEHTCLVTQPIELVFAVDKNAPSEIALKLSIDVGDNGRLTLLENHLASSTVTTIDADIALHARAKFVHGKIVQNCFGRQISRCFPRQDHRRERRTKDRWISAKPRPSPFRSGRNGCKTRVRNIRR